MDKDGHSMPDPRPAASLTSGLLARRGDARPAMRRQPIAHLHVPIAAQDDLGWNDIGESYERPSPPQTSLVGMTSPDGNAYCEPVAQEEPEEDEAEIAAPEPVAEPEPTISPLTRHLEAIAQRISQPPREPGFRPMIARPMDTDASTVALAAAAVGRKAAFTLRLDPERHLRLRLLSAVAHRSAQQLLIEALDALLAGHDQVEDLAGQVETGSDFTDSSSGLARKA